MTYAEQFRPPWRMDSLTDDETRGVIMTADLRFDHKVKKHDTSSGMDTEIMLGIQRIRSAFFELSNAPYELRQAFIEAFGESLVLMMVDQERRPSNA